MLEFFSQERLDFLRFQVVSVVVSSAKNKGSEQDAALHLGAKTLIAGAAIHVGEGLRIRGAEPVANAIKTCEVRRGLGSRDDVVRRHCVLCGGKRDRNDLAPEARQFLDGSLNDGTHFLVEAIAEIFLGNAE